MTTIDEDDEIYTDSDVKVLLIDLNPTFQAPVAITSSAIMDYAQNLEAGDVMEIDIPIELEEKADAADYLVYVSLRYIS